MLPEIKEITPEIYAMAGATNNPIATGGMKTKIQAAEKAVENGIETYIINGSDSTVFDKLLHGENPGTHFVAKEGVTKAKKHWLKHTLKSNGHVTLDKGAIDAVVNNGASLLPSGIKSISGDFSAGDSINIIDFDSKQIVAKGICQYGYRDLARIQGKNSDQIQDILGFRTSKVVIHRDDMVVLSK
jgi:glutamate 5-kinase